jgi:hypothetical protein
MERSDVAEGNLDGKLRELTDDEKATVAQVQNEKRATSDAVAPKFLSCYS